MNVNPYIGIFRNGDLMVAKDVTVTVLELLED
jgi:hypothetical protein